MTGKPILAFTVYNYTVCVFLGLFQKDSSVLEDNLYHQNWNLICCLGKRRNDFNRAGILSSLDDLTIFTYTSLETLAWMKLKAVISVTTLIKRNRRTLIINRSTLLWHVQEDRSQFTAGFLYPSCFPFCISKDLSWRGCLWLFCHCTLKIKRNLQPTHASQNMHHPWHKSSLGSLAPLCCLRIAWSILQLMTLSDASWLKGKGDAFSTRLIKVLKLWEVKFWQSKSQ